MTDLVNHPGLGNDLHPGADIGDQLPAKIQLKIPVAHGSKRPLAGRYGGGTVCFDWLTRSFRYSIFHIPKTPKLANTACLINHLSFVWICRINYEQKVKQMMRYCVIAADND